MGLAFAIVAAVFGMVLLPIHFRSRKRASKGLHGSDGGSFAPYGDVYSFESRHSCFPSESGTDSGDGGSDGGSD